MIVNQGKGMSGGEEGGGGLSSFRAEDHFGAPRALSRVPFVLLELPTLLLIK